MQMVELTNANTAQVHANKGFDHNKSRHKCYSAAAAQTRMLIVIMHGFDIANTDVTNVSISSIHVGAR